MPRKYKEPFTRMIDEDEIDDMPTDEEDGNEKLQNLCNDINDQKEQEQELAGKKANKLPVDKIVDWISLVKSDNKSEKKDAIDLLNEYFSKKRNTTLNIHESDLVPSIISLIKNPTDLDDKLNSLACITYLCRNKYISGLYLVEEEAIPVIFECLESDDAQICELAIKIIGIILKNDKSCMHQVDKAKVFDKLVIVLQATQDDMFQQTEIPNSLKESCAWCISILLESITLPDKEQMKSAIPVLIKYAEPRYNNKSTSNHCLCALYYITEEFMQNKFDKKEIIEELTQDTIDDIRKCSISSLNGDIRNLYPPALKILVKLFSSKVVSSVCVLDSGVLSSIATMLESGRKEILQNDCLKILSYMLKGGYRCVSKIMSHKLHLPMIRYLQYNGSAVQLIAAQCLSILTNDVGLEMAESLIQCNIFGILLKIFGGTGDSMLENQVASIIRNIIKFIAGPDSNPNPYLIGQIAEHSDPYFFDMIQEHKISKEKDKMSPYLAAMSTLKKWLDPVED